MKWPQEVDTVQGEVLAAIGKMFERTDGAATTLLAGTVPGALTEMLPEWEATLNLPDPCAGATPTIPQRLDQVRGRFVGAGGQSRQHFIDFAAALGFEIAITNGVAFTWEVTIVSNSGALPDDVLQCELEAIQPAEGTLVFLP